MITKLITLIAVGLWLLLPGSALAGLAGIFAEASFSLKHLDGVEEHDSSSFDLTAPAFSDVIVTEN